MSDLSPTRQKAKAFLDQLPENMEVRSNGSTGSLFTTLTGMSHDGLQKTWAHEDIAKQKAIKEGKSTKGLPTTTSCNGFTGQLSAAIGSPIQLGQFPLEQALKKAGLSEAWIPADSGKRPGLGDVVRFKRFHVGVSVRFDGNIWHTAEGGQGGPGQDYTKGSDMVRRKQQVWDPSALQGWVDIDILMRLAQKPSKALQGWWRLEVGLRKEYIYIPERGSAQLFASPPASPKAPPSAGGKTGSQTLDPDGEGLLVTWSDGVKDKLDRVAGLEYMLGERGGAQVQGFKLK